MGADIERVRILTATPARNDLTKIDVGQEFLVAVTLNKAPQTGTDPIRVKIRNATTGRAIEVIADVPTTDPRVFLTQPVRVILPAKSNEGASR